VFTHAASELKESWRQIALHGGRLLDVGTQEGGESAAQPPTLVDAGWRMVFPRGAVYRVRGDSAVRVELPVTEPRDEAELFLWAGPVTAMVMWCCGVYPLHAAGLTVNDRVVALFAPPGIGKSTLAAVAQDHGIQIQGDDLLGISKQGRVLSRTGSLRIHPSMAPRRLTPAFSLSDGRSWYSLPGQASARLGALVLLKRGTAPRLTPLTGRQRLALLLSAGFLSRYDPAVPPGWQGILLDLAARLPVHELEVPEGLDRLRASWPDIRSLLQQALQESSEA
jgi:hypothetical protein